MIGADDRPPAALVVLAAGAGQRLGGPKAVARLRGVPFPVHQCRLARQSRCHPTVLVLGCNGQQCKDALEPLLNGMHVIVNHNWETGPFGSVATGLTYIAQITRGTLPAAFVLPVDTLLVSPQTLTTLCSALDASVDAIVPRFQGKKGHPVLLAPRFWPTLLRQPSPWGRLDVALRHATTKVIDTEDAAVTININTKEDLAAVASAQGPQDGLSSIQPLLLPHP